MATITMLAFIDMSLLALLSVLLVWWYRSPELTPPFITIIIGTSWFLGFSGTLLLPLDIAQAVYYGPSTTIVYAWKAVYWSTFLLAWVFLPVLYEAWYAGEFSWKGRIISALKVNLKSYLLTALLGIVFGIYLMFSEDLSVWAISDFFMVFGNTYGFLLVIVLLGNGLVEVPRFIWRYGDTEREIKYIQLQAVSIDTELFDSQCEMDDALKDVRTLDTKLKAVSSSNENNDDENHIQLRLHMDLILDVCDFGMKSSSSNVDMTAYRSRLQRQGSSSPRGEQVGIGTGKPTSVMLSSALKRIRLAQEKLHANKQKWSSLLTQYEKFSSRASMKSDQGQVIENAVTPCSSPSSPSSSSSSSSSSLQLKERIINFSRDFWYRNNLTKISLNILGWLCVCMSGIILWSEVLIGFKISMSPWGILISLVSSGAYHPVMVQILAVLPYAYMSLCTFYSLFKLKLFGLLTLCGPQQSTPGPLLFNAIYLIRLQFPLGLNYLMMLSPPYAKGSRAIGDDVAFKQLFSSIDTIPLFGQGFVVYAPIVLSLLCVFTMFNVYSRMLQFIGVDSDDMAATDSEESAILLKEGAMLLDQATRRNKKHHDSDGEKENDGSSIRLGTRLGSKQVVISPFHIGDDIA